MKNLIVILFIGNIFIWNACTVTGKTGHDGLSTSDCMPERQNRELISDITGKVEVVADQYVLTTASSDLRFFACNLPDSFKNPGLKIKFTIQSKEIFPNERLIGTPGFLINILQLTN